tara:strand:- start:388 stop:681 length:294 start_codon:yes stop_codon:yes gene_type:complete
MTTTETPEALFDNCLTDEDMDQVLGEGKVTVLISYDCWCFDEVPRESDVFDVLGIQVKAWDVVQHLVNKNWDPMCAHRYLESLDPIKGCVLEPFFGS